METGSTVFLGKTSRLPHMADSRGKTPQVHRSRIFLCAQQSRRRSPHNLPLRGGHTFLERKCAAVVFSKERYKQLVERASPPSPPGGRTACWPFSAGAGCARRRGPGRLCALYQAWGLPLPQARTAVSLSPDLPLRPAHRPGGGTTRSPSMPGPAPWCPSPALPTPWSPPPWSSKARGLVTGLGAKLFTVAGPVLVFGHHRLGGLRPGACSAPGPGCAPVRAPWAEGCGSSPLPPRILSQGGGGGAAGRPPGLWGGELDQTFQDTSLGRGHLGAGRGRPARGRPSPWPWARPAWPRRTWTWCWPGTC